MKSTISAGRSRTLRTLIPALLATLQAQAAEFLPPRLYEVTIETGMPHLEENLRYTTTHRRACIASRDLATEFPILRHPTLSGCALRGEVREGDIVKFGLSCDAGHGTTGSAVWHLDDRRLHGRLDVKLGGKNMTFSQTVSATLIGNCP